VFEIGYWLVQDGGNLGKNVVDFGGFCWFFCDSFWTDAT
jgi:hypothetical protein